MNGYNKNNFAWSRRAARGAALPVQIVTLLLLGLLGSCGTAEGPGAYGVPNERALDAKLMTVTTSPIPGAQAKVFPAPPGTQQQGAPVNFCVTDAGYCPLAAAAPAGENCLCAAGSLMYGGKTGAAPQTYQAP